MSELSNRAFEVCHKDSAAVSEAQASELLTQIPDWEIITLDGVRQLQRVYKFRDFVSAMAFANAVTELAEQENHHPSLLVEWGKLTATWWTHTIKGLHQNDFVMAARCDELYR